MDELDLGLLVRILAEAEEEDDYFIEDDDTDIEVLTSVIENGISNRRERTKISNFAEKTVPLYDDIDFKAHFRMTRETFDITLTMLENCDSLKVKPGPGRNRVSLDKQLLLTLWFLANQETYRQVADRFGVSNSTAHRCIRNVAKALAFELAPELIKFPSSHEEASKIAQRFVDRTKRTPLEGIVGAIDGTYIPIKAPRQYPEVYVNRKGFHSVVLQGIVDADMLFTHVYSGPPGCVHDASVLDKSDIEPKDIPASFHLIGDGAYPCKEYLLSPFRDNGTLSREQQNFNFILSSNRMVVERAFGLLKGRWRKLSNLDIVSLKDINMIIVACCVLHNICLLTKDISVEEFDFYDLNDLNDSIATPSATCTDKPGVAKRASIASDLMAMSC